MELHDCARLVLGQQDLVAEGFYAELLGHHPAMRPDFDGVDLKRQAVWLTMALVLVAQHFETGFPATERYLKLLGHQHKVRRNIPPEAYGPFRDCLPAALDRIHGADWDDRLALRWRHAIDLASETMIRGYDGDYRD